MVEHLIHGGDILSKGQGGDKGGSYPPESHDTTRPPLVRSSWKNGSAQGELSSCIWTMEHSRYASLDKSFYHSIHLCYLHSINVWYFQVNFFEDHTKVVLAPDGHDDYIVTYINSRRQSISYRLQQLRHFGCRREIGERLTYAHKMLQKVIKVEEQAVWSRGGAGCVITWRSCRVVTCVNIIL